MLYLYILCTLYFLSVASLFIPLYARENMLTPRNRKLIVSKNQKNRYITESSWDKKCPRLVKSVRWPPAVMISSKINGIKAKALQVQCDLWNQYFHDVSSVHLGTSVQIRWKWDVKYDPEMDWQWKYTGISVEIHCPYLREVSNILVDPTRLIYPQ